jgi:hypothetical protein
MASVNVVQNNIKDRLLRIQTDYLHEYGLNAAKFTTVVTGPTLNACVTLVNKLIRVLTDANLVDHVEAPLNINIDQRLMNPPVLGTVNVINVIDNTHIVLNPDCFSIIIDHKHLLSNEVLEAVDFSHIIASRCYDNIKKVHERHLYLVEPNIGSVETRMKQLLNGNQYALVNHKDRIVVNLNNNPFQNQQ